ncbi:MAG TPA: branched-chain amino acid ABC transporter permease [Ktedonobacterales bacterium]|jgi:branched-subunit amino acid ABC-type transport system permease component|nr:branched-chain amino acid ABC transporter permease [Ktedonobacterales bacterium]
MLIYLHALGFGLVTASILSLASVGLTLQFGVTNYVNFAYGELLTFGAYFAWLANSHYGWNIWLALLVGAILTGILAVILNLIVLQPFTKRQFPVLFMLVVTFGLSLILSNVLLAIYGADFQRYTVREATQYSIGPFLLTNQQLIIIGIAIAAMAGVHVLLNYTKIGKAMRAMSDNPTLARNCGIDTELVTNFTWLLSGFLAGLAGVVLALNISSFQPAFGGDFLFVIFAAVILGGIGRPYGAMAGALVIGIVTEVAAVPLSSDFKNDAAFAILVLVLLFRPQGIFASEGKA